MIKQLLVFSSPMLNFYKLYNNIALVAYTNVGGGYIFQTDNSNDIITSLFSIQDKTFTISYNGSDSWDATRYLLS